MFGVYQKPTTFNITYTGAHEDLSPEALNNFLNRDKLMYLDTNGKLRWRGIDTANGIPSLDGNGKLAASQIPVQFDEFLQFANIADFPVSGVADKYYVALNTNKIYRWSGVSYVDFNDLSSYYMKSEVDTLLTTEQAERDLADNALDSALNTETINRTNADTTLQNNVNTVQANLTTETNNRINNHVVLTTNINTVSENLNTETTLRVLNDSLITADLNNEISARSANDANLQANINNVANNLSSESTNRTNQINDINNNAFMKNATGTTAINSSIEMNGNNIVNAGNVTCSSISVNSNTGIADKIRFNGSDIDVMDRIIMNGNNIINANLIETSTINVTSVNGINNKVRFDGAGIDIMAPIFAGGNSLTGANTVESTTGTFNNVSVLGSTGINNKIRFDGAGIDIMTPIVMGSNPISGTGDISGTNLNATTNITSTNTTTGSVIVARCRTNEIRRRSGTPIANLRNVPGSFGGPTEFVHFGRTRWNETGANDDGSIYRFTGFASPELHIIGCGLGRTVAFYDTVRINQNLISPLINSVPISSYCIYATQTFVTLGTGVENHQYNAPSGFEICNAQWTQGVVLQYVGIIVADLYTLLTTEIAAGITLKVRVILRKV